MDEGQGAGCRLVFRLSLFYHIFLTLRTEKTDTAFLNAFTTSSGNPRAFVWNGFLSSLEGTRGGFDGGAQVQNPDNADLVTRGPVWPQLRLLE
jgi:hypothetical protein